MFDELVEKGYNNIVNKYRIFENELSEIKDYKKDNKKKNRKKCLWFLLYITIFDLLIFKFIELEKFFSIFIYEIVLVIPIYVALTLTKYDKQKIKEDYETYGKVYNELTKEKIDAYKNIFKTENIHFIQSSGISKKIYEEVPYAEYEYFNSYNSLKYVIDNIFKCESAKVVTSKGQTDGGDAIIFNGIFAKIESNVDCNERIYLITKGLKRKHIDKYIKNNEMEKIDFDYQEFDAYTSNRDLFNKIINEEVINMLKNFSKKDNIKFEILIENNKIYIKIPDNNFADFINFIKELKQQEGRGEEIKSEILYSYRIDVFMYIIGKTIKDNIKINLNSI